MESHLVRTACFLSVVFDGIAMAAKTSASLRKAMSFRADELSSRSAPRRRNQERFLEQVVLRLKVDIVNVVQFTQKACGPDRGAMQMADIPVPQGQCRISAEGGHLEDVQEVVKLVPQERVQQRTVEQIVELLLPNKMWRTASKIPKFTTAALFGKDL